MDINSYAVICCVVAYSKPRLFCFPVCGGGLKATRTVKHMYSHAKYGDQNYDNKEDCDWIIQASPGENVHLTFLTFELEDEHDCGYDYVEVFSGYSDSGPSYGKFCGNTVSTGFFFLFPVMGHHVISVLLSLTPL